MTNCSGQRLEQNGDLAFLISKSTTPYEKQRSSAKNQALAESANEDTKNEGGTTDHRLMC